MYNAKRCTINMLINCSGILLYYGILNINDCNSNKQQEEYD